MESDTAYIRRRELAFRGPQDPQAQAEGAWLMLREVPHIREVHAPDGHRLVVTYDVREITYAELEQALTEVGFQLDNSLLAKLRRALYQYNEDTIRANLGLETRPETLQGAAQRIFVNLYRHQDHGCRDHRPRHWREYL
ncbi:hypothetical protein [Ectothiorhodospira mobilis]|uniref:hypothetical protein n=1 Tax=Ectothiorhodospira mobilis TaxID=195064 RepID=UPI001EE7AAA2|nr:hypothetical protein [Ectothiorhodospira mobilis]MCG5536264.1 hypothetical protein [Ectothiorhodospira mobilis]